MVLLLQWTGLGAGVLVLQFMHSHGCTCVDAVPTDAKPNPAWELSMMLSNYTLEYVLMFQS